MRTCIAYSLLILALAGFIGCRKNELGGKASVKGVVMHHSKPIPNAYVYIKFNAKDFPGDDYTLYDTYVKADGQGNYEINNFYKGNYYLFAEGYDYAIAPPYLVKGGIAVTLRNNEHLTMAIAVTEGD